MKNENKIEKRALNQRQSIVCHWDSNHKHFSILKYNVFDFLNFSTNPVQKNWNKRYYKYMASQLKIKIHP